MGTRNLTIVKLDGDTKIRQYGAFDGYPLGVGARIAEFIHTEMDLPKFKANLKKSRFIPYEEVSSMNQQNKIVSLVAKKYVPELMQYEDGPAILRLVQDGALSELLDSGECEEDYTYEIDLDQETIAVTYQYGAGRRVYKFKEFTGQSMKELQKTIDPSLQEIYDGQRE